MLRRFEQLHKKKNKKGSKAGKKNPYAVTRSVEKFTRKYKDLIEYEEPGYLTTSSRKTENVTQESLAKHVDLNSLKKMYDLKLEGYGEYNIEYTRNSKYLALGSRKGHLALIDWKKHTIVFELELKETIRDIAFLQNYSMLAVAQKKITYVYDQNGTEIHAMKGYTDMNKLEYLPYHFLLAGVSDPGFLAYTDVSTGKQVASSSVGFYNCQCMTQNRSNAVIFLGEKNGMVSMWTPNMFNAVIKMKCHRGMVKSVCVDSSGHLMATCGSDPYTKIWDIRKFGSNTVNQFTSKYVSNLCGSQLDLLATASHDHVNVYKNFAQIPHTSPYMYHKTYGRIKSIAFCPYEDILGIGHSNGFSSILIPGSGNPRFDSFENNPYESERQLKEDVVHKLLDKIPHYLIQLDGSVLSKAIGKSENRDFLLQAKTKPSNIIKRPKIVTKRKYKVKGKVRQREFYDTNAVRAIKAKKQKRMLKQKKITEKEKETEEPLSSLDRFNVNRQRHRQRIDDY